MPSALALAIGLALAQSEAKLTLTPAQMEADLRQLARAIDGEWSYAEDRRQHLGINAHALAEAAIARSKEVEDDAGFVGLVRELVAQLKDGHASVNWSGEESWPFRRWPFEVADTTDGLVITELIATWNETLAPFEVGDILLAVDGEQVEERIARLERRTNASTDGSRRRWALANGVYNATDPSRYEVRRADGSELEIEAHAAGRHPETDQADRAAVEHRRLADGVAYVRLSTFALADSQAWAEASPAERPALLAKDRDAIRAGIASALECKALVLDLRGNGGGTDLLAMDVAISLLGGEPVYYGLSSKLFGRWSKPTFYRAKAEGEPPRFAGQLVVLVDEGTFSASDNLCRCLDDLHPDVTFVGRPTAGGTGAPRPAVTLEHSRIIVGFCTMRVVGPKGELIDGRGTVPDVLVRATRASVLAGRDLDLEAALASIR